MRKLFIIWLILFLPLLLFGGRMQIYDDKAQVYKGPIFDSTDNYNFHIDSVKVTKDTTYVFCCYYAEEDSWANISDSTYLEDVESKEKYFILKSIDLPYAPEKLIFEESGYYLVAFLFPTIKDVKTFHFIENGTSKAFNIYNVNLNNCINSRFDDVDLQQLIQLKDSFISVNDTLKSLQAMETINNLIGYYFGFRSYYYLSSLWERVELLSRFDLYEDVISLIDLIMRFYPNIGDKNTELVLLQEKANNLFLLNKDEEAISTCQQYISLFESIENDNKDWEQYVVMVGFFADVCHKNKDDNRAVELFEKCLQICNNKQLYDYYLEYLFHLSICYSNLGRYEDAINIVIRENEAKMDSIIKYDEHSYLQLMEILSENYLFSGKLEKGKLCKERVQEKFDKRSNENEEWTSFKEAWNNHFLQDTRMMSDAYFEKGMELYNQGQYQEAISYFSGSLAYDKESGVNDWFRDYEYLWIGSCYYKLGDEEIASKYSDYSKFEPINRFSFHSADSLLCITDTLLDCDSIDVAITYMHDCIEVVGKLGGEGFQWMDFRLPKFVRICMEHKKFDDALEFCLLALDVHKRFFSEKSQPILQCYLDLLLLYGNKEDYLNAIKYGQMAISLIKQDIGNPNIGVAVGKTQLLSLLRQTQLFIMEDNYEQASELCDQALVLFKELGKENDRSTISELHNISHAYSEKKMYSEAAKTESILVEVYPLATPDNMIDYALYLNDLSLYLLADDNIILAEKNIQKALSLIKNERDVNLIYIYVRAAEIYQKTTPVRADLSIKYQKKAVEAYANAYGTNSSQYISELGYLAGYYETAEDYENACNAYMELAQLRAQKEEEKDMQGLLPILDRIILCSRMIGNTEQEKHYKDIALEIKLHEREFHRAKYTRKFPTERDSLEFLAITEKDELFREQLRQLKDDSDEIERNQILKEIKQYLLSLPDSYAKAGALSIESHRSGLSDSWKESIEYGIEALRIYDALNIKTDMYVIALISLADAYNEIHNPAKAYDYILRAFELRDDYLSSDNIYYDGMLNDLALYSSALGNYRDAIKYGTMAVEAKEPAIYTKNPYGYFLSLNNLATYYGAIGEYKKEFELLQYLVKRAEEIDPSVLELDDCTFLYNLAYGYIRDGNYVQAIETGLKIKKIRENLGEKNRITNIYILLARAYILNGNIKDASFFANKAKCIQEEIGGDDNLRLAESYDLLAMTSLDMGNFEEAERMKRRSISLVYKNIMNNFVNLSSDDRASYWYKYSGLFNMGYPDCFYKSKIDDAGELYNKSALFAKGILLNTDTEMSKLIMGSGDEEALAKYQCLLLNRSLLSKVSSGDNPQNEISVDSLRNETNKIERELIKECKVFGDYTAAMRTTWQDVQAALKPNDIAIEFLSFPLYENNDSVINKTLYVAIILTKSDNSPRFIELFDEKELESIMNNSEMLYNLIWGRIEECLSTIDNIYFSPAGKLYNINIEDLPEIVGRNNERNYYRVSSTRLLAHQNNSQITEEKAIIYGGLKYDVSISELVADSKLYINKESSFRGDVESLDLRSGWDYLPETLIEVNEIESALKKRKIPTQIYTDTLGTEASFKSLDGQPCKIIHIATHGFYYTESDSIKMRRAHLDYMANQVDKYSRSFIEDCSLTRSGLLMAGCNNILCGYKLPDNVDDGILFAKEVAEMNLKNVELVTISSCDSGLGDVTGDGVIGLQRAFKKAGAQSILMSLHKVDDEATRILMVEFYRNLISGKTKHQSLKDAQKHLKKVENGKYNKPEYWASFIMLDGLN